MTDSTHDLVRKALAGEREAVRALVDVLAPVIKARVARALLRYSRQANCRRVAQECDDLTQSVFLSLFENQGYVLQSWDPARGLSLANFIRLVADRHVAAIMRSGRRNPWTEDPTETSDIDNLVAVGQHPEISIASRELAQKVADNLREKVSPLGYHLFLRLFVDQESVEGVCAEANLSAAAVYAWRSRLRRLVEHLTSELLSETPASQRSLNDRGLQSSWLTKS